MGCWFDKSFLSFLSFPQKEPPKFSTNIQNALLKLLVGHVGQSFSTKWVGDVGVILSILGMWISLHVLFEKMKKWKIMSNGSNESHDAMWPVLHVLLCCKQCMICMCGVWYDMIWFVWYVWWFCNSQMDIMDSWYMLVQWCTMCECLWSLHMSACIGGMKWIIFIYYSNIIQ